MSVKFTNNAKTSVVTGINASATSLTVASASSFPSLSGAGDYCYLTIQQATGAALEVVKATALSGNTFTIVRAQDNTSAGTWSAGDVVELRVTAAALDDIVAASIYSVGDGGLTEKNFTTALKTKLDGVEASADVTDTTNVVAALTAGANVAIASDGTISSTDTNTTYSVGDGGLTQNNFTNTLKSKLDGIEAGANNYSLPFTDNSTNWNTAYGWGNHASAGYLTSFDITTQTDSKYLRSDTSDTMSGSLTVTGTVTSNSRSVGTQSVVTTAPTSASGFPDGHVWYVVS